jgi:hypothetical protein
MRNKTGISTADPAQTEIVRTLRESLGLLEEVKVRSVRLDAVTA